MVGNATIDAPYQPRLNRGQTIVNDRELILQSFPPSRGDQVHVCGLDRVGVSIAGCQHRFRMFGIVDGHKPVEHNQRRTWGQE